MAETLFHPMDYADIGLVAKNRLEQRLSSGSVELSGGVVTDCGPYTEYGELEVEVSADPLPQLPGLEDIKINKDPVARIDEEYPDYILDIGENTRAVLKKRGAYMDELEIKFSRTHDSIDEYVTVFACPTEITEEELAVAATKVAMLHVNELKQQIMEKECGNGN